MNNSSKLEKYSEYVNKLWKIYMNRRYGTKQHIFLNDMLTFTDKFDYDPIQNENHKKNYKPDLNEFFVEKKCYKTPTKILPKELVNDICKELTDYTKIPNWKLLEVNLNELSDYLLYSNINLDKYCKFLQNKDTNTINVLIQGAGPTGLYIANMIHHANMLNPKINLLIIDNRIAKEGYRLPYTRNRIYGIALSLFSTFFPKFVCMEKLIERGGISIKYLENLLLMFVYHNKIPIYFTNKIHTEEKLKNFIERNNRHLFHRKKA